MLQLCEVRSAVTQKVYLQIGDVCIWQENLFLPTVRFLHLLGVQNSGLATICLYKETCHCVSFMHCQSKRHLKVLGMT